MESFGQGIFQSRSKATRKHTHMRVYRDGRAPSTSSSTTWWRSPSRLQGHHRRPLFPDQAASFEKLRRFEQVGVARLLAGALPPMVDTQKRAWTCTGCSESRNPDAGPLIKSIERAEDVAWGSEGIHPEGLLGPCELHWKNNYTIDPRAASTSAPWLPDSRARGAQVARKPRRRSRRCSSSGPGRSAATARTAGCVGGCLAASTSRRPAATKWPARRTCRVQFPRERRPALPRGVPAVNRSSIEINRRTHEDQSLEEEVRSHPVAAAWSCSAPPVA